MKIGSGKNILCNCGFHKLKIWYEDDYETCKICVRCGEEQTISFIPDMTSNRRNTTKTQKEIRRKKLAKIQLRNELLTRNTT